MNESKMLQSTNIKPLGLMEEVDTWPYLQKDHQSYIHTIGKFHYFMLEGFGMPFGYILTSVVNQIDWQSCWKINAKNRFLTLRGKTAKSRSDSMADTLLRESKRGVVPDLKKISSEMYPIYGPNGDVLFSMSRSAADLFGIEEYGVFLIVSRKTDNDERFWVAERSMSKSTFPGKLDLCVGGSLQSGESPTQCLAREAEEEASFRPALIEKFARSCGAVRYHLDRRANGKPGSRVMTQYIYELQLPTREPAPKPNDGEVENFKLMSLRDICNALERREFKPNCAMVWIDYLVRHGYLTPENNGDYLEIVTRLHRNNDMFYMEI